MIEPRTEKNILDITDVILSPNSKCPLCGFEKRTFKGYRGPNTHSIAKSFSSTPELTAKLEIIKAYQCRHCGLLYCDPAPIYE